MSAHFDPRGWDDVSGPARRALLEHAAACASCREALVAHEPSALFALLALAPMPAPVLDAVSSEVARRAGIGAAPAAALADATPWVRRATAAAIAVAGLLTAAATFFHTAPTPVPLAPMAVAPRATPRADVEVAPGDAVSQVVDFTVGDTQVVMVYNPELHL